MKGAPIVSAVVAGVMVLALLPPGIKTLARFRILDRPGSRSLHSSPTPRGAGLVTGAALGIALLLGWDPITVSLSAVAFAATMLGGLEDLKGVGITPRIAGQLAIAGLFLGLTWKVGTPLAGPATAIAIVFIVGYTNAFNFMDGINGISAITAAVSGAAYVAEAQVRGIPDLRLAGTVLAVTALCFLPFNFPAARIFLGDSGSYSFGAVIACTAVAGWRAGVPPDVILAPLALYLADTGTVLAKRLFKHESLMAPHRSHAFQRLAELRKSHAQSTVVVLICTATTAGLGLLTLNAGMGTRVVLDTAIVVVIAWYLALPMLIASHA
jgi:UDP-GlcNAc:undecaprenyl-phosphate/decaprenyl-phosphate GlcNAc-1-phosphate transferase